VIIQINKPVFWGIALLLIIGSTSIYGNRSQYQIRASKEFIKIPQEFNYLLQSLNQIILTPAEESKLQSSLKIINHNIQRLDRRYLLFMLQIEIYHSAAGANKNLTLPSTKFDIALFKQQRKIIENQSSLFGLWLFDAIYKDLERLDSNPKYQQIFKSTNTIRRPEIRKLKRTVEMLAPWYNIIVQGSVSQFKYLVKSVILSSTIKLAQHTSHLANFSGFFPKTNNFGKLSSTGLIIITPSKFQNITKTPLDSLLNSGSTILTIPDKSTLSADWAPREEKQEQHAAHQVMQNPSYVAPESLPTPVDDWMLPAPTDDW
jgi:hypothetical protein